MSLKSGGETMLYENGRHEYKFIISMRDYHLLKRLLSHILRTDPNSHSQGGYNIRSLYFDDPLDSAYYEKMDGVFERTKYRLRFYDYSDAVIKLEKKGKRGGVTYKSDMLVDRDFYNRMLVKPQILDVNTSPNTLYQEFLIACKTKHLLPKALVSYDREAYLLPYEGIRICFDHNIKTALPSEHGFSKSLPMFPVLDASLIVFEVKYKRFLPNYVRDIIERIDTTHTAFSKYGLSRSILDQNYKFSK
jgi:hypothetical protein